MKTQIVASQTEDCTVNLRTCPETLNIVFRQLNYSLPCKGGMMKEVLHDVSGQILSGRLTAILGPSGAGKTSLLNVLAGFKTKGVNGSILVNGMERDLAEFRTQSCYITQDMSLLGKLTTLETLVMAARMKLTSSQAEQSRVVSDIIDLLGITKSRDTFVQNLSGGEKKRLSIGLELITNPPIMFFDEPTSGLDSVSSAQIMFHLRSLASSGRAVACVIHQPNSRLCNLFDDMILLAEGSVLYCGPTNQMVSVFEEAGFPCPQYYNRADFALEVACMERGGDLTKLLERSRLLSQESYDRLDVELRNIELRT